MNYVGKNITLLLIIGVLLFFLYNLFQNQAGRTQPQDLPYSEMLTDAAQGHIKDVTIKGSQVLGTREGQHFMTYAPPNSDVATKLIEKNVNVRVTPDDSTDPDATLHGTILSETVAPLTYNSETQQSSSYLITIVVAVELKSRDGKILYQNNNYVFRQQYQSTTNLPTLFDESPAAVQRLSKDFAHALVADVLESF